MIIFIWFDEHNVLTLQNKKINNTRMIYQELLKWKGEMVKQDKIRS